jgi:ATP phosphoribosyltransferase regulatory subunit
MEVSSPRLEVVQDNPLSARRISNAHSDLRDLQRSGDTEALVPLIPDGTRFTLPKEHAWREELRAKLEGVLHAWGYDAVQTPALEVYDPHHPQAEKSFKLVDRDGTVLALRGEYTTAIGNLVRAAYTSAAFPLRLRYGGPLWVRTRDAELGRAREYTQVGAELLGISTRLADAEIVTLALECLDAVGLERAAVELGHPGFVRAVLEDTGLEGGVIEDLRTAIHRKNGPELHKLLETHGIHGKTKDAVMKLIDLYGSSDVLREAERFALNDAAKSALEELRGVAGLLPGERFLFDLGIARRLDYYTGVIFQAYTPDFGQPICGGGRYDNAPNPDLEPIPAAGFALGLERLMTALGEPIQLEGVFAIALDAESAKNLRFEGKRVIMAWTAEQGELEEYARTHGIPNIAMNGRLRVVKP